MRRAGAAGIAAVALVLAISACTAGDGDTVPVPTVSPGPTTPSAPTGPQGYVDGGDASENREWFDQVNRTTLQAAAMPGGRIIIDALVDAGFEKSEMEVTADRTPDGHNADAVQFSVRIGDECLIGQASASGYSSVQAAVLATGSCLLGVTRAIDW